MPRSRILLAVAALCAGSAVQAQVHVGVRAGVTSTSPSVLQRASTRLAPAVSVFADVPVAGRFSVRPEAFYSSEGVTTPAYLYSTLNVGSGEVTQQMTRTGAVQAETVGLAAFAAVSVPLGGLTLSAYAGPAVSAKVRERNVFRADFVQADASNLFARTAVSAVGGASVSRGRVGLDVRVAMGLTNAAGESEQAVEGRSRVVTAALVVRPSAPRGRVWPGRPALGVRAGVSRAGLSPGLFAAGSARTTPTLAVFADVPVRGPFSVRPEAFFSSEGERIGPSEFAYTNEDGTPAVLLFRGGVVQAEHVGAGLFAAVAVPIGGLTLGAYAGPAASVKVRERDVDQDLGTTSEQSSNFFNPVAVSGVGGVSVSRGALGLDLRVARSVTDVINREVIVGRAIRSQVTSAALVYQF